MTQPGAPEMGAKQEAGYDEAGPDDDYDEAEGESEKAKEETYTVDEHQPDNVVVLHGNDDIPPGNTGVDTIEDPHKPTGVEQVVCTDDDDDSPDDDLTELNIGRHNLQRHWECTYHHLKTQSASQEWGQTYAMTDGGVNLSTPQVSMKMGLELFGQAGDAAVKSKMGQLHEWK